MLRSCSLFLMTLIAAGCLGSQDTGGGAPRTIQETGFLDCEPGHADCGGGLWCTAEGAGGGACVDPPDECADSLDCECLAGWMCPDGICVTEGGERLVCKPAPPPPGST